MKKCTIRFPILLAGVVVASFVLACAGSPDGFYVSVEDVRREVDTVAIARVQLPYDVDSSGEIRALLEQELTSRLESAGVRVVPASAWEASWRRIAGDIGGIYDPNTGEADDEKYEIVLDWVQRDLSARHGVDAVAYLSIEQSERYGASEDVFHCGGRAPIFWPGGWYGTRTTMMRIDCLVLRLFDRSGRTLLYGRQAPLEVSETYGHQTRARRQGDERFQDRPRILEALEAIVGTFVKVHRQQG